MDKCKPDEVEREGVCVSKEKFCKETQTEARLYEKKTDVKGKYDIYKISELREVFNKYADNKIGKDP